MTKKKTNTNIIIIIIIIIIIEGMIGPVVCIYIYILGRGPCSRTSSSPRTGKRYYGCSH